jgi:hypothetical protein
MNALESIPVPLSKDGKSLPEGSRGTLVVGCGPSLSVLKRYHARLDGFCVIACNRAIEIVPADYWIWVDRIHYERSKWHPHATHAQQVGPAEHAAAFAQGTRLYRTMRTLTHDPNELCLTGGTLTLAAHLAVRLGSRRVVFFACDAWSTARGRYHAWDGKPLTEAGLRQHEAHLQETTQGIRRLGSTYGGVELLDATLGETFLGLPAQELELEDQEGRSVRRELMGDLQESPFLPDQGVASGYGKLVTVTPAPEGDVVLWFEDSGGGVRAVRMGQDLSAGLALTMKGEAWIVRT